MRRSPVVFAAVLALAGCQAATSEPAPAASTSAAAGPAQTEAQAAYARANAAMHDGMAAIDADPDVAFMQGMIAHHRGAVAMSEVALKYGKDAKVRDLAQRIIAAQQGEIAEMEAWLQARGKAAAAPAAEPATDHSHH